MISNPIENKKKTEETMAKKTQPRAVAPINCKHSYAIFPTPSGKGYGCFAFEETKKNTFKIAVSFCHPLDRVKFSKNIARRRAASRLLHDDQCATVTMTVENGKKLEFEKLIEQFIVEHSEFLPSWAWRSFNNKLWSFTLYQDNLSFTDVLDRVLINQAEKKEVDFDFADIAADLIKWAVSDSKKEARRREYSDDQY